MEIIQIFDMKGIKWVIWNIRREFCENSNLYACIDSVYVDFIAIWTVNLLYSNIFFNNERIKYCIRIQEVGKSRVYKVKIV